MEHIMRNAVLAIASALTLVACGQQEAPPPSAIERPAQVTPPPWFICDAISAPLLLVFERANGVANVAQYGKPNGELVQRTQYTITGEEGAAGSVFTSLTQNGAEAGHVRQINPGMLETPGSAYTLRYTSVRIGDRDVSCRWMPRTRVFGFTGRRSFVVHEDQSGDLIYTTYDFANAAEAQPIDQSENGRTTTFSAEVRDGAENVQPTGTEYRFEGQSGFVYTITLAPDGTGRLDVSQNGAAVQSEPLVAYQQGQAAE
jgi:hypothetical protein